MPLVSADKFQLVSKATPSSKGGRFVQFPLVRMFIPLLFFAPAIAFNNILGRYVLDHLPDHLSFLNSVEQVLSFIFFILLYRLYTRWIEKRPAYELGFKGAAIETGVGIGVGGGMILLLVAMLASLSFYKVADMNSISILVSSFIMFGMGAFIQELLFRVLIFRALEELLGSWIALFGIGAIFALAHLGNENATITTSLLMFPSDIILTAAFIYTRRIWMVWGIHWGWNFFQDGVFGMANSGIDKFSSWISPTITGPEWLTGGAFGIEASYVAVALNLVLGIWLMRKAGQSNCLLPPKWKKVSS